MCPLDKLKMFLGYMITEKLDIFVSNTTRCVVSVEFCGISPRVRRAVSRLKQFVSSVVGIFVGIQRKNPYRSLTAFALIFSQLDTHNADTCIHR